MIRFEISCRKTGLSLDFRISAICEGGIVEIQFGNLRTNTALLDYMFESRRGPRAEKNRKFRPNMVGIIATTG
jgi:hypothetical protein